MILDVTKEEFLKIIENDKHQIAYESRSNGAIRAVCIIGPIGYKHESVDVDFKSAIENYKKSTLVYKF